MALGHLATYRIKETAMNRLLSNCRSPVYADKDNSAIDLLVDHAQHGTIPFTARKGEEIFARAEKGEFGAIKPYLAPVLGQEQLTDWANTERIRRVNLAYVSPEQRQSAYGYMAKIASIPEDKRTAEQKKDLEILHKADEWEEEMIARVPIIVAQNSKDAITRDSAWPANPVAQALKELAEQC